MNLYDLSISKGFTNTHQLFSFINNKKLKTVVVPGLASGHTYPRVFNVGMLSTAGFSNHTIGSTTSISNLEVVDGRRTSRTGIYLKELELYVPTIDDLKQELTDLKEESSKKIESLEKRITILDELGLTEYNEKLISVVDAIKTINPQSTPKDRLKLAEALTVSLQL